MTKLHTYLNFDGNAEEALNLYKSVFGGEFTTVTRYKDMPMEGVTIPAEDQDKIMHMGMMFEDNILMASDVLPFRGHTLTKGNNAYISVQPTSKEEADRIFNGLSEGAEIEMEMAQQIWGDYYGSLKDKFGVHWMVNYSASSGAGEA